MSNIGFRIFNHVQRPDRTLVESFKNIPVANIADNMNRRACMGARIQHRNSVAMAGTAFTLKTSPGDNLLLYKVINLAQPGDVIVVDAQGALDNAICGELIISWLQRRGVAGIIIDGAIRDASAIRELSIPVYAAGVTPNGPFKNGPGEVNVPVTCGGIVVKPGDILVGDDDGVVVIDPKDAPEVLDKVQATMAKEEKIMKDIETLSWDQSWAEIKLHDLGCEVVE